ncbi:hypothetical protein STREPTOSP366_51450 [Streptomyces variabilis]
MPTYSVGDTPKGAGFHVRTDQFSYRTSPRPQRVQRAGAVHGRAGPAGGAESVEKT